jgi:hypothetical protein
MKELNRATSIRNIREPRGIAFTDFSRRNKCKLSSWPRSMLTSDHQSEPSAFPKARIIGEFFHELLDEISAIESSAFSDACTALERGYYRLLADYERRYSQLLLKHGEDMGYWAELSEAHASALSALERQFTSEGETYREVEKKRDSLGIIGKLDEITVSNGLAIITEYKSIYEVDEKKLDRYTQQLIFYSLLLEEEFNLENSGLVRGFAGLEVLISWTDSDRSLLQSSVNDYRKQCSLRGIDLADELRGLASVDRSDCVGCRLRSGCPALKDVSGTRFGNGFEIGFFEVVADEGEFLTLVSKGGTLALQRYRIRKWQDARDVSVGDELFLDRLSVDADAISTSKHTETRFVS